MERSIEPKDFEFPLEFQFAMRKAEIQAQEMTWDQLNLYQQRLMEWQAVKSILADENIELDFDIPTELELEHLTAVCMQDDDDDDDDGELLPF
jgi:hypothetical protein